MVYLLESSLVNPGKVFDEFRLKITTVVTSCGKISLGLVKITGVDSSFDRAFPSYLKVG